MAAAHSERLNRVLPERRPLRTATSVEARWGHPGEKYRRLVDRIKAEAITQFSLIADDFLDLIWTLDRYRIAQVPPRGMGNLDIGPEKRLQGIYRGKGNYFSSVIALLVGQQTSSQLAPRSKVQGFSQEHQIDVAWPVRSGSPIPDPLVCVETKLTGAPAFGTTRARGALNDWSNRRKELKFAATDLKLNRRQAQTSIDHWDYWRKNAAPSVYFLWGARLRPGPRGDKVEKMIFEVQALTSTYLDAAGIFAYRERADGTGYEPVPLPPTPVVRVTSLDDVVTQIAAEIKEIMRDNDGRVPAPETPTERIVDLSVLEPDSSDD